MRNIRIDPQCFFPPQQRLIPLLILLGLALCTLPLQAQQPLTEFSNLWLPGFSGGGLYLFASGQIYWGGSFRFDLVYGLDRKRPYASHMDRGRYEVYLDCGLYLNRPGDPVAADLLFLYTIGASTSFETPRAMERDYLIPQIGLELGGITSQREGSGFLVSPLLGINIFSKPTATLSLDALLLLNTLALEEYLGVQARLSLNFIL